MTGKVALIVNPDTGLVLDGSDVVVKLTNFNGSKAQQWILETRDDGHQIFINRGNDKALDAQTGAKHGVNLITYPKHGHLNQQWIIHEDHISSVIPPLVLTISGPKLTPGSNITLENKHLVGSNNQHLDVHQYTL